MRSKCILTLDVKQVEKLKELACKEGVKVSKNTKEKNKMMKLVRDLYFNCKKVI